MPEWRGADQTTLDNNVDGDGRTVEPETQTVASGRSTDIWIGSRTMAVARDKATLGNHEKDKQ